MASNKNRILEPYGYIEQVDYNMMGFCSIDLTPINDKNKEQDEEINNLSGLTQNAQSGITALEQELQEFSGMTVSAISSMTESINANAENIETLLLNHNQLSSKVSGMDETLSSLTESVNSIEEDLSQFSGYVTTKIGELTDNVESLGNSVDDINNTLGTKLSIDDAEAQYAKKDTVYTKEEVDGIVSGELTPYATKEWVEEQDYVNKTDADSLYAAKEAETNAANALEKANDVFAQFNQFKGATNQNLASLNDKVSALEAKEENDISDLSSRANEVSAKTDANSTNIASLNEIIETKADKTTTDALSSALTEVQATLPNKVDTSDFNDYKTLVAADINYVKTNYATKSSLAETNNKVDEVEGALYAEIANRVNGDYDIKQIINGEIKQSINDLQMKDSQLQIAVETLNSNLAKEVTDRENGDTQLLGLSTDPSDRMTLYGVKAYATAKGQQALSDAKKYTDDAKQEVTTKVNDLNTKLDNILDSRVTDDELAAAVNEAKTALQNDLTNEINRAKQAENDLKNLNNTLQGNVNAAINSTNKQVATNSTVLSVITSWKPSYEGDTNYNDNGNGVLDVLHREFHNLKNFVQVSDTVEVKNNDEVALGVYNSSHTGADPSLQTIFSVGIGTSDADRKNALEIRRNGDVYMLINGNNYNVNDLLSKLIDRFY